MSIKNIIVLSSLFLFIACACNNKPTSTTSNSATTYQQVSPDFNADSAYTYVDKQVSFGYRVPNTAEHIACGDYLTAELKRHGAEVQEQKMTVTAYDGTKLNARNIIGSYGAEKKNRILLFAHWDTRPYSDHDPNPENWKKPLLGANDGASGVGVLLEIARVLQTKDPEVGVDIIFFDAEDYGKPEFVKSNEATDHTWCLGSRYWAENPHVPNYKAKFGILLDMVGAEGAVFRKEYFSVRYAKNVVEKIWNVAGQMNNGRYFKGEDGGATTDDHIPVNEIRRIPSVNIIHHDENSDTSFFHSWHTQKDDMSNISKETLKVVGQTVLEVIYKEK